MNPDPQTDRRRGLKLVIGAATFLLILWVLHQTALIFNLASPRLDSGALGSPNPVLVTFAEFLTALGGAMLTSVLTPAWRWIASLIPGWFGDLFGDDQAQPVSNARGLDAAGLLTRAAADGDRTLARIALRMMAADLTEADLDWLTQPSETDKPK